VDGLSELFRKVKPVHHSLDFLTLSPPPQKNAATPQGLSEQSVSLQRCWGMGDGAIQKLIQK